MKKTCLYLTFLVLLLAISFSAWAGGSCTSSKKAVTENGITWYVLVSMDWTADVNGTVSSGTGCAVSNISGIIAEVHFEPTAAGTQPDDAYDVTILDSDGTDVAGGLGANLSNAATVHRTPRNTDGGSFNLHNTTLTPAITNAGDANKGTIRIFLR